MFVKTKADAVLVINNAINSHRNSWKDYRSTKSYLLNLDPPLEEEKLKDNASWSNNWNFGKGRAKVQKIIGSNSSQIVGAISLCDISFENFDVDKHKDKELEFLSIQESRADVAERLGACFAESIADSVDMMTVVRRIELDSLLSGFSSVISESDSIFPTAVPYDSIAFEPFTETTNIKTFVVFDLMKGSDIFDIYTKTVNLQRSDNPEISKDYSHGERMPSFKINGWNIEALSQIIFESFNSNDEALKYINGKAELKDVKKEELKIRFSSWEDVDALMSNYGEYWCSLNTNNVYIAKIYQFLDDGLYESYCFISSPPSDGTIVSVREDIAFYRKTSITQDEVISIVRDQTVEGSEYIHDIKGSGRIFAEYALRYDLYKNDLLNKLCINNAIWVSEGNGVSQANPIRYAGGIVFVPDSAISILQRSFQQNLSDNVNVLRMEDGDASEAVSYADPNVKLSNRPTRQEVGFVSAQTEEIKNSDIPFKLKSYSQIVSGIFRNIILSFSGNKMFLSTREKNILKTFIAKIKEEFSDTGLTESEIKNILKTVKSVEISPVMSDRDAIGAAMQIASTANARKRLLRMLLASYGFNRRQIRDIIKVDDYGRDAELAAIENSMFETTREVVFGLGQDHITHLQAHFYKIDYKFKAVDAGEDPVACFNFINNAIPNCELHVNAINGSPFYRNVANDYIKTLDVFKALLKGLASTLDKMKNEAQKNAEQQSGGGLTEKEKIDLETDRIKLMEKIKMSQARAAAMMDMKVKNFNLEQKLKELRASADIENKNKKTSVDIDAKLTKVAAEMV